MFLSVAAAVGGQMPLPRSSQMTRGEVFDNGVLSMNSDHSDDTIEMLKAGVQTESAEQTRSCAKQLACVLPEDIILALSGDLGTGKSTFVSGLAEAWGIEKSMQSPTYNIFHLYHAQRNLVHADAYRLEDSSQMDSLLLEDFLTSPYCVALEWPEHVQNWLPDGVWWLSFGILREGVHHIALHR